MILDLSENIPLTILASSQLLMQRSDIDTELRDNEGLTAFDLYNSTVEGTFPPISYSPSPQDALKDKCATDLFTWGGNRWVTDVTCDRLGDLNFPHVVMQLWGIVIMEIELTLTML